MNYSEVGVKTLTGHSIVLKFSLDKRLSEIFSQTRSPLLMLVGD